MARYKWTTPRVPFIVVIHCNMLTALETCTRHCLWTHPRRCCKRVDPLHRTHLFRSSASRCFLYCRRELDEQQHGRESNWDHRRASETVSRGVVHSNHCAASSKGRPTNVVASILLVFVQIKNSRQHFASDDFGCASQTRATHHLPTARRG